MLMYTVYENNSFSDLTENADCNTDLMILSIKGRDILQKSYNVRHRQNI